MAYGCCLAGTVRAEKSEGFSLLDLKGYMEDAFPAAIITCKILNFKHAH